MALCAGGQAAAAFEMLPRIARSGLLLDLQVFFVVPPRKRQRERYPEERGRGN